MYFGMSTQCLYHGEHGMGWDNGNCKSQWTCVGNAGQPSCNNLGIIIDFCLHFRLGELKIISENTKRLLRDDERVKWIDYYELYDIYDLYDDFDDYDYDDY